MKQYFFALVLAAALAGQGLAASVATTGTGTNKSATPARHGLTDAQIERNIKARLGRGKMAGKEHFTVSVQDGVATFEGKTNVIQHKGTATRIAHLSGAVGVQNHIQISEEAKAKAAEKLARYRPGSAVAGSPGPARATVLPGKRP